MTCAHAGTGDISTTFMKVSAIAMDVAAQNLALL
jgi:hypothetical protein